MNHSVSHKGEALFRSIVRSHVADALVLFERQRGSERVRALIITPTRSTVVWVTKADLAALRPPGSDPVAAAITFEVKKAFGIA